MQTKYSPVYRWKPVRRTVDANCESCPWGLTATNLWPVRHHLSIHPDHTVAITAVVVTAMSVAGMTTDDPSQSTKDGEPCQMSPTN